MHLFKNKYFWISIGFLLLIGMVVLLGSLMQWSTTVQLIAIIALLLLAVVVLMIGFMRAARSANLIEDSIRAQGKKQLINTRPDKRSEIEELQQRFDSAIERLKQSKLGRGRSGRAALYAMPWYLFIGPPGAGKTTAILNSGLNFPLGTDRVRGVGGTRNCDWFFTDQAILLDTAGRYVTENEDAEEWQAFLDTLRKHRKERPINGAIIGIGLDALAQADQDEIEWHAVTIRRRIDELVGRLGVRFPVFLVFTKCDLLQGFVEFFGDMPRKEREQIWGCTFEREEIEKGDMSDVFAQEFDRLYQSLLTMRGRRLSRSMKREDRQKVYVFPLEFQSIRDNLSSFVSRLFQANPYQDNPVFRGFYFSSGTQEGAPIDRVIQSIARQFDLPAEPQAALAQTEQAKSYFIKDLFTDVIVPDRYMVRHTSRRAVKGYLARAGVAAVAIVLLGLWLITLSQAVLRNQQDLISIEKAAAMVASVRWSDGASSEEVDHMHTLLSRVQDLESAHRRFRPLRLGLDRSERALDPARRLYYGVARDYIASQVFVDLDTRLRDAVGTRSFNASGRDALYDHFRAYLLLSSEHEALEQEVHRVFLEQYLTQASAPQADAGFSAVSGQREQSGRQAAAYVDGLFRGRVAPFDHDEALIARVRSLIYEPPSPERVYRQIREEGEATFPPVTLAEILQGRHIDMFSSQPQVPGIFTKRAYRSFVEDAVADAARTGGQDDIVMGYSDEDRPESLQNGEALEARLMQLYFNDYATEWERFLRSVRLSRFSDLRAGSQFLTDLGSPYESPLLYVLAHVSQQTQFQETGVVDGLLGRAEQAATRRADAASRSTLGQEGAIKREQRDQEMHPVDRRFARLHELAPERASSGEATAGLQRALQSLQSVATSLEELQGNPALAAEYANKVFGQNGWDLARHQQTINTYLTGMEPQVQTAFFVAPVMNAWDAVLAETQSYLNERWRADVYEQCRALSGRFPLDPTSDVDAPLDVFEEFFHPETGAIDAFFRNVLVHFMTPDGRSGRSWNGRGVQISRSTFEAAEAARRIGNGLFGGGVMRAEFELQPEVPLYTAESPRVGYMEIDIHGRTQGYDMGFPSWSSFAWPGRAGASIRLTTQAAPISSAFEGDWAWFRLLQAADVQRLSQTEYEVRWPIDQGITARYRLRTRNSNNPFGNVRAFFNFECPASL